MRLDTLVVIVVVGVSMSFPMVGAYGDNPSSLVSVPERSGSFGGPPEGIGTTGVDGKDTQVDASQPLGPMVSLDAMGRPIPETRVDAFVPGQVIARFGPGAIELPEGSLPGSADHIVDWDLRDLAGRLGVSTIARVYRSAVKGGKEVLSRTGHVVKLTDVWDVYLLHVPEEADIWGVVDSLRTLPSCIYAEPNGLRNLDSLEDPDDDLFSYQWNLSRIGMMNAWGEQTGSTCVHIGFLDTGIDYMNTDLGEWFGAGYKVAGGYDYINNDNNPMDDASAGVYDSHGTHVAGIAGALTNNDAGVAGIAGGWGPVNHGCSLYALKVGDSAGWIWVSEACNAIRDAWPMFGIRVLNASYGGGDCYAVEREAIQDAHKCGVVFVASKGNDGGSSYHFPSDYDHDWVISVGASNDMENVPPDFNERRVHVLDQYNWSSNYGNEMDVLAPGVRIWSTLRTSHGYPYGEKQGTSMAAPHVTGLAGLILSEQPRLPVDDVEGIICASCTDILSDRDGGDELTGYDEWSGYGRIYADSALKYLHWPYMYDHYAETGGYSVGNTSKLQMRFYGDGDLYGTYFAKRYDVRCDITYLQSYGTFPHVWGRGYGASVGWSAANPNYQVGFCRLVRGSETHTGCQLQTYVYEIWTAEGRYEGWYPCRPSEAVFAYTVLAGVPPTSVEGGETVPGVSRVMVYPASPNPLRESTRLSFLIARSEEVSVKVFEIGGREVRSLFAGELKSGEHGVNWDGRDNLGERVSPGVYLCTVATRECAASTKLVVLK